MKVNDKERFDTICKRIQTVNIQIGELNNSVSNLMDERNKLFSKIVTDNKLLQGDWKINPNIIASIVAYTNEDLKREKELRGLFNIGYNIEENRYLIIYGEDAQLTLTDNRTGWMIEIFMLNSPDIDAIERFLKEQKINIQFDDGMKSYIKRIKHSVRLMENLIS